MSENIHLCTGKGIGCFDRAGISVQYRTTAAKILLLKDKLTSADTLYQDIGYYDEMTGTCVNI